MPIYRMITPVRGGKRIDADHIELTDRDGRDLVAIGAVEPAPGFKVQPTAADKAAADKAAADKAAADKAAADKAAADKAAADKASEPKPLHKQNKAELLKSAADAGVTVADDATNKQIVAAIEAKRAEAA